MAHSRKVKGEVKSRKIFFLRMGRVEQMVFQNNPQSRGCKMIETAEMNDVQGTDEGTASGRNIEPLRVYFIWVS